MKRINFFLVVLMFLVCCALPALAVEDAPYPELRPEGEVFQPVTLERGGFDLNKPMYCLHDRMDGRAIGWRMSEEKRMTPVNEAGKTLYLCPGVTEGQRFHPYQPGAGFLKIEWAHQRGFMEGNKHLQWKDGNVAYVATP